MTPVFPGLTHPAIHCSLHFSFLNLANCYSSTSSSRVSSSSWIPWTISSLDGTRYSPSVISFLKCTSTYSVCNLCCNHLFIHRFVVRLCIPYSRDYDWSVGSCLTPGGSRKTAVQEDSGLCMRHCVCRNTEATRRWVSSFITPHLIFWDKKKR